jgi:UDP-N-acetyl-D-mannosaminuronate dehydrogenase
MLRAKKYFAKKDIPFEKAHVLVIGVTYKENVNDIRESPSILLKYLFSMKACVYYNITGK